MAEQISVCHIVNAATPATMPCDLATMQATLDGVAQVGVLGWFGVDSFHGIESVETVSLNSPNTFRITRSQYAKVKSMCSKYDIIHTHNPHSGLYGKLIAKRLGKPVVQTEHNNHRGYTRKGRIANGVTNVVADAIVCVSNSVRDSFRRWEKLLTNDGKISIINNGIVVERLESARTIDWSFSDATDINPEAIIVGSAGMLTEQKAHSVLVEAVDKANAESERPIELVISGDGPLREQLETQIQTATHSDRLHLLGFLDRREQVYKMMHEIDIYAMPSRWEGFCVAALEGMALDNACVFAEIPEFKHPFDGVARFHPVDDSVALAGQLVSIADDYTLRQQLAEKAKSAVVTEYTLQRTAEAYLEQYQSHL